MKKIMSLLLFAFASLLSLTSCTFVNPTEDVDKTKLNYTYKDYLDNNAYDVDGLPSKGDTHLLVIPVWFTNSSTYITTDARKESVRQDIQTAFFGSKEETGWHSVSSYYKEESLDALNLSGVVTPWWNSNVRTSSITSTQAVNQLVTNATNWYFNLTDSHPRSYFDQDQNGYLDSVILIYGAPDYASSGSSNNNLWAFVFWLQGYNANISKPNPNAYLWASYDFMYDSSTARSKLGNAYGGGDCSHLNIDAHTYIHESGHLLGLDDYYDYSNQYNPAGGFSMQDYNVGGHDPYSVMSLGWVNPYIPTSSTSITIKPFVTSHDLILLSPSFNSYKSPFDEYLLLELYTPTGLNKLDSTYSYRGRYPKGASDIGIRLWHVDSRLSPYVEASDSFSENLITKPSGNYVTLAMSNTYYAAGAESNDYISVLGKDYANYNLLQLIRNNKGTTYRPTDSLSNTSLFKDGSTFDMNSYSNQFVHGPLLNNKKALNWSFSVSISTGSEISATINLRRE